MDYEVFEPDNEHLAHVIVKFLQGRGYNTGYQLGYPHNKIFLRVEAKEEADKISVILRGFMEKSRVPTNKITINDLDASISIRALALTESEDAANLTFQSEPETEEEPESRANARIRVRPRGTRINA